MQTDPNDDYARGFVPFLGTTIYLDSHPLIPRVETEFWVEKAIEEIMIYHNFSDERKKPPKVLDLFAGSGAIGVAVLKHIPNVHVTFGEIEERHLATIKKNILENGIDPARVEVVQTDVWKNIHETFDYILANPPYISHNRHTAEESTNVEPPEALYAPDDGFFYIKKFIQDLSNHLSPTGVAYIEHEPFHIKHISNVAKKVGLVAEHEHDQYEKSRVTKFSHPRY